MNEKKRLIENWPLPIYAFVPGHNIHPNKPGGHMHGKGEVIAPEIDQDHPQLSKEYCYALDLFNFGFYWESHVYLEAIWNTHKRVGPIADLMKGLIKIAAAGVKFELGQLSSGIGHLERAHELIKLVQDQVKEDVYLGLNLADILTEIGSYKDMGKRGEVLTPLFSITPIWNENRKS